MSDAEISHFCVESDYDVSQFDSCGRVYCSNPLCRRSARSHWNPNTFLQAARSKRCRSILSDVEQKANGCSYFPR
jgi:hypothetical protein